MMPSSKVSVPFGLSLRDAPDGMVIRRRWFILMTVPIMLVTVVWDIGMVYFCRSLLRTPDLSWTILWFPTGFRAVGFALTYWVFAMFLNRTEVRVSASGIRVSRGPLPWPGGITVNRAEADKVFVVPDLDDGTVTGYRVVCLDGARKQRALLTGLSNTDQAEFVVSTICQRLGLPEAAV